MKPLFFIGVFLAAFVSAVWLVVWMGTHTAVY